MTPQELQILAARFNAEAENDINNGLAEGLDPHEEYELLVSWLNGNHLILWSPSNGPQTLTSPMTAMHQSGSHGSRFDGSHCRNAVSDIAEVRIHV